MALSWLLLLAACQPVQEELRAALEVTDEPEELRAALEVTDEPGELPAPVSVRATSSQAVKPTDDPNGRIRDRFLEIGADAILVVRAHVRSTEANIRTIPERLYWGTEPRIATTLQLQVEEMICGPFFDEIAATYPGGSLPDGRYERTELMPRDPAIGEQLVLFLRRVDDEYFLDLGRHDSLTVDEQGVYRDLVGNRITLGTLKDLCP